MHMKWNSLYDLCIYFLSAFWGGVEYNWLPALVKVTQRFLQ